MVDKLRQYSQARPRTGRVIGWALVLFGFVMLVTPLTPGGSLFFVGLELLGLRIVGVEKIKGLFRKPEVSIPELPHVETVQ